MRQQQKRVADLIHQGVSFQDYTATIFLRQRWRDSRLVFPGNESVSVDGRLVSLLWIPDTFIPDSKRSFLHDVTVENRLIRIFSNGTVLYALRYILPICFTNTLTICTKRAIVLLLNGMQGCVNKRCHVEVLRTSYEVLESQLVMKLQQLLHYLSQNDQLNAFRCAL